MGDAARDRLSDAGSIPAISTKGCLTVLLTADSLFYLVFRISKSKNGELKIFIVSVSCFDVFVLEFY